MFNGVGFVGLAKGFGVFDAGVRIVFVLEWVALDCVVVVVVVDVVDDVDDGDGDVDEDDDGI